MEKTHATVRKLPDTPGVYLFFNRRRAVLYVGKATSLRDRVRSYFASDLAETRGVHMVNMVKEATRVEFRTTDSVLEALILEAHLIKEFKPPYNTRDKDDKSFNWLVITTNETYPRLLTVRGKELQTTLERVSGERCAVSSTCRARGVGASLHTTHDTLPIYGPFPHASEFREALKLIRKIFPYYDTVRPVDELIAKDDRKLRFNQAIGVYPSATTTPRTYLRTVRHIRNFFEGKKKHVINDLERDMRAYAAKQEYEAAGVAKRQLFALKHINDVSLIRRVPKRDVSDAFGFRIEAYDVAHLSGTNMVGVMTVVDQGEAQKNEYRTFNVRSVATSNDTAALREVLSRRLAHPEWPYPRLVVVDGGTAQLRVAQSVLAEAGSTIPVVAVTKDERHRPKAIQGPSVWRRDHAHAILLANAEAHRFSLARHRRKRTLG